jgi:hypothetical protein
MPWTKKPLTIDSQPPHHGDQRRPAKPEAGGSTIRATDHTVHSLEHPKDVRTHHLFQRQPGTVAPHLAGGYSALSKSSLHGFPKSD